jgi:putative hydrolase of the HAD superfamily
MVATKAILFDMGGTLVFHARNDPQKRQIYLPYLMTLLDVDQSQHEFFTLLSERSKAYKKWSEETSRELSEEEIWTQWMFPDWPEKQIRKFAVQLNYWWRAARGVNLVPADMQSTLIELAQRGYQLGLISNTTSRSEGIDMLENHGLLPHFGTIILSTVCGFRKPDPAIFYLALAELGVSPDEAAYIGNRPDRDVLGARHAGIAKTVIIRLTEPFERDLTSAEFSPNYFIHSLSELLEIFPEPGCSEDGNGIKNAK